MITQQEYKRIKEILGNSYVSDLREVMKVNNIEGYSDGYIRQIVTGKYSNPKIESCVWKLTSVKLEEKNRTDAVKKTILNS